MAVQEKPPHSQGDRVSEFGFRSEIETLGVISVLKQIRDSGPGNGNLTVDQVIHLIELDNIAKDLSKTPAIPTRGILAPVQQPRLIGDPIHKRSEIPTTPHTQEHILEPGKPAILEAITAQESAPQTTEEPIQNPTPRRRKLRDAKPQAPVVFKDSKHHSKPPVPEMGKGPIARNVPPPPVRQPDPKE